MLSMEVQKVYAILYNSYEFDDLGYGDLTPIFLSLDENNCKRIFEKWKPQEIDMFNRVIKEKEQWLNENPKRQEDYQININTDREFEMYLGNWCYHYALVDYDLDRSLRFC